MIKHVMDILRKATSFLNPGQIPVMACDCPIFAKAKFIQWTWPITHGEGLATQLSFKKQVQSLIDTVTGFGNPFEDDCSELLILNTQACADDDSVIETVRSVETLGKAQYQQYKKEVITERTKSIHDSIKKNSLALLRKAKSKSAQKIVVERNNTSLFGRLYIANQQREGDPGKFFSHENQTTPPSLSDFGKIRLGQKSLLLS